MEKYYQHITLSFCGGTYDRGYTAHACPELGRREHISEFGIINMNGRLYDPLVARMLSPDPYIMGEQNTQGYNRYSYGLNNPLKYTVRVGSMRSLMM